MLHIFRFVLGKLHNIPRLAVQQLANFGNYPGCHRFEERYPRDLRAAHDRPAALQTDPLYRLFGGNFAIDEKKIFMAFSIIIYIYIL